MGIAEGRKTVGAAKLVRAQGALGELEAVLEKWLLRAGFLSADLGADIVRAVLVLQEVERHIVVVQEVIGQGGHARPVHGIGSEGVHVVLADRELPATLRLVTARDAVVVEAEIPLVVQAAENTQRAASQVSGVSHGQGEIVV